MGLHPKHTVANGDYLLTVNFVTTSACSHTPLLETPTYRYTALVSRRFHAPSQIYHGVVGSECKYFTAEQVRYIKEIFDLDPALLCRTFGGCVLITLES